MDIESLKKSGCPKCGSDSFVFNIETPVSTVSAGACFPVSCANGNRHESFECHDCGHELIEDFYDKELDGRSTAIDKVMANGGIRQLLKID